MYKYILPTLILLSPSSLATPLSEKTIKAHEYVDEIVEIMKTNVLTKDDVDWLNLESQVKRLSSSAESIEETYPAIKQALKLVKTNHSSLRSSSGKILAFHTTLDCYQDVDMTVPEFPNIGYIRIESFSGTNQADSEKFASAIQKRIAELDSKDLKGWIVDIRNNRGGNMWPMIAGVGPLLHGNVHGYFSSPESVTSSWGYSKGSANYNDKPKVSVKDYYTVKNSNLPIAIISSKRVASSGEALMISFKHQNNVKFFGNDSCGASTSNRPFKLKNGDYLVLTTATMLDKNNTLYGNEVNVDIKVADEIVILKAQEWIQEY